VIAQTLGIAGVLFGLYFVLPLDHLAGVPLGLTLSVGLFVLLVVSGWQLRAVINSDHPTLRAIRSLAGVIPLFLSLFASAYYVMAAVDPGSFNSALSRLDALYFTVTVFSTVGFGDIVANSQPARAVVTLQMMLNLVLIGVGVRVLTRAVQIGKARQQPNDAEAPPPGGPG
jgi:hypothetical protein